MVGNIRRLQVVVWFDRTTSRLRRPAADLTEKADGLPAFDPIPPSSYNPNFPANEFFLGSNTCA